MKKTQQIQLNKNLDFDFEPFKANITKKRYTYYDFNNEKVREIAKKDIDAVADGVRIDPPVYYYCGFRSYLNNDNAAKVNRLADEIKHLFECNNIEYSKSWSDFFQSI